MISKLARVCIKSPYLIFFKCFRSQLLSHTETISSHKWFCHSHRQKTLQFSERGIASLALVDVKPWSQAHYRLETASVFRAMLALNSWSLLFTSFTTPHQLRFRQYQILLMKDRKFCSLKTHDEIKILI